MTTTREDLTGEAHNKPNLQMAEKVGVVLWLFTATVAALVTSTVMGAPAPAGYLQRGMLGAAWAAFMGVNAIVGGLFVYKNLIEELERRGVIPTKS